MSQLPRPSTSPSPAGWCPASGRPSDVCPAGVGGGAPPGGGVGCGPREGGVRLHVHMRFLETGWWAVGLFPSPCTLRKFYKNIFFQFLQILRISRQKRMRFLKNLNTSYCFLSFQKCFRVYPLEFSESDKIESGGFCIRKHLSHLERTHACMKELLDLLLLCLLLAGRASALSDAYEQCCPCLLL